MRSRIIQAEVYLKMPIYEYKCNECDHVFEAIQKFSDAPLTECPECKGKVEKLISQSAFHLKGGGWYKDGYSSSSSSKDSGSSSSSPKKPDCSGCPQS